MTRRVPVTSERDAVVGYLEATMLIIRQLLDWKERWDRERHLGPEVEAALLQEWRTLTDRAHFLMTSDPRSDPT